MVHPYTVNNPYKLHKTPVFYIIKNVYWSAYGLYVFILTNKNVRFGGSIYVSKKGISLTKITGDHQRQFIYILIARDSHLKLLLFFIKTAFYNVKTIYNPTF